MACDPLPKYWRDSRATRPSGKLAPMHTAILGVRISGIELMMMPADSQVWHSRKKPGILNVYLGLVCYAENRNKNFGATES